jgi:Flp pilus assembly protein TadG
MLVHRPAMSDPPLGRKPVRSHERVSKFPLTTMLGEALTLLSLSVWRNGPFCEREDCLMRAISHFFKRLRRSSSGNALVIVAAGMPALIGGAGFAVDMSQWYMWKSELQYAVDQAAIAGAYARTSSETEADYQTRAGQEYTANLSTLTEDRGFEVSDPAVRLENWATGTSNSVVVTASVTKALPFSSFLTGSATTVRVSSQAAFEKGVTYTSCLIAVDPDATGAVTIGGSAQFIAGCGIAALSDAEEAISVDGNPTIEAGWLISAGGIDEWFKTNTTDTILENQSGLVDPFAGLTPPDNPTRQSATCPKGKTSITYIADQVTTRTQAAYSYYKKSGSKYTSTSYTGSYKKPDTDTTTTEYNVIMSAMPTGSTVVTGPTESGYQWIDGSGGNKIYQKSVITETKTYVNPHVNTSTEVGGALVLQPGTYDGMDFKCDVVFNSGIYVINGGVFNVNAQYNQTGAGVMFVLKNGAGIVINGGANVNLTAMSVSQLETAGVSHAQAVKLAGMLIFEDPNSPGNTGNKLNGNANTVLNGTVYLPVSNLDVRGTAGVTSQCLMLVASTITISGNAAMESFCPANQSASDDDAVLKTNDRVRLVS